MNIHRVTLIVVSLSVWIFGCYLVCNSDGYLNKYLGEYYKKVFSMNPDHLNLRSGSLKPHERRDPKKWVSENISFGLKSDKRLKNSKPESECYRKLSPTKDRDLIKRRFNVTTFIPPLFPVFNIIEQSLDHFNTTDNRTWHQYFVYNKTYATNDTLNFLLLCGEGGFDFIQVMLPWTASAFWAKQFGANYYVLEHRFYGYSQPFSGETKVDLQYLSSEQAIADAAVFVKSINEKFNITNPKWIVFGCSYPGMLAAWMRMKYPDVVLGAVASSAPVQAALEFRDYFEVSAKAIEQFGTKNCSNDIRRYFSAVQVLLLTEKGRKRLGVGNDHDLFWYIFNHLPTSQFDDFQHIEITKQCENFKKMADDFSDPNKTVHWNGKCDIESEGIVNGSVDWGTAWFWQTCTEFGDFQTTAIDGGIYDDAVLTLRCFLYRLNGSILQGTKFSAFLPSEGTVKGDVDRHTAWFWQKCTEFGYFQTTAIDGGIYDDAVLTLRNSIKQFCTYNFPTAHFNESSIQSAVDRTNSFYGGNKSFNATNVVFVNGSEDPWHALSVYDPPNDSVKSILVQDTSHCADYYAESESDPQGLKNSRIRVKHEIAIWLGLKK